MIEEILSRILAALIFVLVVLMLVNHIRIRKILADEERFIELMKKNVMVVKREKDENKARNKHLN